MKDDEPKPVLYFGVWRHWSMEGYQTDYKCCDEGHADPHEAFACRRRYSESGWLDLESVASGSHWETEGYVS